MEAGTGVEEQRCQPSLLGCQADFGLVSRVLEPDSPLADSMFHDIAGKGPQQIEIAAHVACGVTASWEVNIFYVGRRT